MLSNVESVRWVQNSDQIENMSKTKLSNRKFHFVLQLRHLITIFGYFVAVFLTTVSYKTSALYSKLSKNFGVQKKLVLVCTQVGMFMTNTSIETYTQGARSQFEANNQLHYRGSDGPKIVQQTPVVRLITTPTNLSQRPSFVGAATQTVSWPPTLRSAILLCLE